MYVYHVCAGLRGHGKNFAYIQSTTLKTKTLPELVEFYYCFKTHDDYKPIRSILKVSLFLSLRTSAHMCVTYPYIECLATSVCGWLVACADCDFSMVFVQDSPILYCVSTMHIEAYALSRTCFMSGKGMPLGHLRECTCSRAKSAKVLDSIFWRLTLQDFKMGRLWCQYLTLFPWFIRCENSIWAQPKYTKIYTWSSASSSDVEYNGWHVLAVVEWSCLACALQQREMEELKRIEAEGFLTCDNCASTRTVEWHVSSDLCCRRLYHSVSPVKNVIGWWTMMNGIRHIVNQQ